VKAYEIRDAFGIDALALSERPDPVPGPGQVVVRTRAVALNFSRPAAGQRRLQRKLALPMTPCSDCAGEVAAVGDGVTRVKIGDRVAGIFMQAWIDGEVTKPRRSRRSAARSRGAGAIGPAA